MTDRQILANPDFMGLLQSVAQGRVQRGAAGGSTALMAPYLLGDDPIRLQLMWLQKQDLIALPISGPPLILPRGRRLLAIHHGQLPMPLPD